MSTNLDLVSSTEIFRKNHPIIIAMNRHLSTIRPMRVEFLSGGYSAGQVMAKRTSSGLFGKYDNAATGDGLDTAVCVLMEDVQDMVSGSGASGSDLARGIYGGIVFTDKLIGLDSAARVDLGAKNLLDSSGINLLKF